MSLEVQLLGHERPDINQRCFWQSICQEEKEENEAAPDSSEAAPPAPSQSSSSSAVWVTQSPIALLLLAGGPENCTFRFVKIFPKLDRTMNMLCLEGFSLIVFNCFCSRSRGLQQLHALHHHPASIKQAMRCRRSVAIWL